MDLLPSLLKKYKFPNVHDPNACVNVPESIQDVGKVYLYDRIEQFGKNAGNVEAQFLNATINQLLEKPEEDLFLVDAHGATVWQKTADTSDKVIPDELNPKQYDMKYYSTEVPANERYEAEDFQIATCRLLTDIVGYRIFESTEKSLKNAYPRRLYNVTTLIITGSQLTKAAQLELLNNTTLHISLPNANIEQMDMLTRIITHYSPHLKFVVIQISPDLLDQFESPAEEGKMLTEKLESRLCNLLNVFKVKFTRIKDIEYILTPQVGLAQDHPARDIISRLYEHFSILYKDANGNINIALIGYGMQLSTSASATVPVIHTIPRYFAELELYLQHRFPNRRMRLMIDSQRVIYQEEMLSKVYNDPDIPRQSQQEWEHFVIANAFTLNLPDDYKTATFFESPLYNDKTQDNEARTILNRASELKVRPREPKIQHVKIHDNFASPQSIREKVPRSIRQMTTALQTMAEKTLHEATSIDTIEEFEAKLSYTPKELSELRTEFDDRELMRTMGEQWLQPDLSCLSYLPKSQVHKEYKEQLKQLTCYDILAIVMGFGGTLFKEGYIAIRQFILKRVDTDAKLRNEWVQDTKEALNMQSSGYKAKRSRQQREPAPRPLPKLYDALLIIYSIASDPLRVIKFFGVHTKVKEMAKQISIFIMAHIINSRRFDKIPYPTPYQLTYLIGIPHDKIQMFISCIPKLLWRQIGDVAIPTPALLYYRKPVLSKLSIISERFLIKFDNDDYIDQLTPTAITMDLVELEEVRKIFAAMTENQIGEEEVRPEFDCKYKVVPNIISGSKSNVNPIMVSKTLMIRLSKAVKLPRSLDPRFPQPFPITRVMQKHPLRARMKLLRQREEEMSWHGSSNYFKNYNHSGVPEAREHVSPTKRPQGVPEQIARWEMLRQEDETINQHIKINDSDLDEEEMSHTNNSQPLDPNISNEIANEHNYIGGQGEQLNMPVNINMDETTSSVIDLGSVDGSSESGVTYYANDSNANITSTVTCNTSTNAALPITSASANATTITNNTLATTLRTSTTANATTSITTVSTATSNANTQNTTANGQSITLPITKTAQTSTSSNESDIMNVSDVFNPNNTGAIIQPKTLIEATQIMEEVLKQANKALATAPNVHPEAGLHPTPPGFPTPNGNSDEHHISQCVQSTPQKVNPNSQSNEMVSSAIDNISTENDPKFSNDLIDVLCETLTQTVSKIDEALNSTLTGSNPNTQAEGNGQSTVSEATPQQLTIVNPASPPKGSCESTVPSAPTKVNRKNRPSTQSEPSLSTRDTSLPRIRKRTAPGFGPQIAYVPSSDPKQVYDIATRPNPGFNTDLTETPETANQKAMMMLQNKQYVQKRNAELQAGTSSAKPEASIMDVSPMSTPGKSDASMNSPFTQRIDLTADIDPNSGVEIDKETRLQNLQQQFTSLNEKHQESQAGIQPHMSQEQKSWLLQLLQVKDQFKDKRATLLKKHQFAPFAKKVEALPFIMFPTGATYTEMSKWLDTTIKEIEIITDAALITKGSRACRQPDGNIHRVLEAYPFPAFAGETTKWVHSQMLFAHMNLNFPQNQADDVKAWTRAMQHMQDPEGEPVAIVHDNPWWEEPDDEPLTFSRIIPPLLRQSAITIGASKMIFMRVRYMLNKPRVAVTFKAILTGISQGYNVQTGESKDMDELWQWAIIYIEACRVLDVAGELPDDFKMNKYGVPEITHPFLHFKSFSIQWVAREARGPKGLNVLRIGGYQLPTPSTHSEDEEESSDEELIVSDSALPHYGSSDENEADTAPSPTPSSSTEGILLSEVNARLLQRANANTESTSANATNESASASATFHGITTDALKSKPNNEVSIQTPESVTPLPEQNPPASNETITNQVSSSTTLLTVETSSTPRLTRSAPVSTDPLPPTDINQNVTAITPATPETLRVCAINDLTPTNAARVTPKSRRSDSSTQLSSSKLDSEKRRISLTDRHVKPRLKQLEIPIETLYRERGIKDFDKEDPSTEPVVKANSQIPSNDERCKPFLHVPELPPDVLEGYLTRRLRSRKLQVNLGDADETVRKRWRTGYPGKANVLYKSWSTYEEVRTELEKLPPICGVWWEPKVMRITGRQYRWQLMLYGIADEVAPEDAEHLVEDFIRAGAQVSEMARVYGDRKELKKWLVNVVPVEMFVAEGLSKLRRNWRLIQSMPFRGSNKLPIDELKRILPSRDNRLVEVWRRSIRLEDVANPLAQKELTPMLYYKYPTRSQPCYPSVVDPAQCHGGWIDTPNKNVISRAAMRQGVFTRIREVMTLAQDAPEKQVHPESQNIRIPHSAFANVPHVVKLFATGSPLIKIQRRLEMMYYLCNNGAVADYLSENDPQVFQQRAPYKRGVVCKDLKAWYGHMAICNAATNRQQGMICLTCGIETDELVEQLHNKCVSNNTLTEPKMEVKLQEIYQRAMLIEPAGMNTSLEVRQPPPANHIPKVMTRSLRQMTRFISATMSGRTLDSMFDGDHPSVNHVVILSTLNWDAQLKWHARKRKEDIEKLRAVLLLASFSASIISGDPPKEFVFDQPVTIPVHIVMTEMSGAEKFNRRYRIPYPFWPEAVCKDASDVLYDIGAVAPKLLTKSLNSYKNGDWSCPQDSEIYVETLQPGPLKSENDSDYTTDLLLMSAQQLGAHAVPYASLRDAKLSCACDAREIYHLEAGNSTTVYFIWSYESIKGLPLPKHNGLFIEIGSMLPLKWAMGNPNSYTSGEQPTKAEIDRVMQEDHITYDAASAYFLLLAPPYSAQRRIMLSQSETSCYNQMLREILLVIQELFSRCVLFQQYTIDYFDLQEVKRKYALFYIDEWAGLTPSLDIDVEARPMRSLKQSLFDEYVDSNLLRATHMYFCTDGTTEPFMRPWDKLAYRTQIKRRSVRISYSDNLQAHDNESMKRLKAANELDDQQKPFGAKRPTSAKTKKRCRSNESDEKQRAPTMNMNQSISDEDSPLKPPTKKKAQTKKQ